MYRFSPLLALMAFLAACSPVRMQESSSRPPGEARAGVGEVMLRVSLRDNLPDEFGGADIFGRTRDRGFVELRYMGLDDEGRPIFRRREVEVETNETVYHHMAPRTTTTFSGQTSSSVGTPANAWRPPNTGFFSGRSTTTGTARPVVASRGDEVAFPLDLSQSRTLTLRGRSLEILDANASGVHFFVGPEPAPSRN